MDNIDYTKIKRRIADAEEDASKTQQGYHALVEFLSYFDSQYDLAAFLMDAIPTIFANDRDTKDTLMSVLRKVWSV